MTQDTDNLQQLLLRLSTDATATARADAAAALAHVQAQQVTPALISALADAPLVAWAAADALISKGGDTVPHLLQCRRHAEPVQLKVTHILGELCDARGIPFLIESLSQDATAVRQAALSALTQFGQLATQPLCDALTSIASGDLDAVCSALGQIGDPAAVGALSDLLNGAHCATTRRASALALGQLDSLASVDALTLAFNTDSDKTVRATADFALTQLLVRAPALWRRTLNLMTFPERRCAWFELARRQNALWLHDEAQRALDDQRYLTSLSGLARWRYKNALRKTLKTTFGSASSGAAWPPERPPKSPTTLNGEFISRYGRLASTSIFRRRASKAQESCAGIVHTRRGAFCLDIKAQRLSCTLTHEQDWTLNTAARLKLKLAVDRSDLTTSPNAPATLHVIFRQRTCSAPWTEAGVSVHVRDSPELDAFDEARHSFPYIAPDVAAPFLSWIFTRYDGADNTPTSASGQ